MRSQRGLTVTPGDEMKQFRRDRKMPTFFAEHRLEPPGSPGYSQTKTLVSGSGFGRARKWKRTVSGAALPIRPFARRESTGWFPLPGPPVVTPEEALIACQIKSVLSH